ncbi:hypothetical protein [Streptomyces sp. NPDC006309]|uniref:hypothetical protein n=1 Tax=Streptomyces sp. NPDC006309 TaxID=3156749 RepID=UPI0033BA47EC
MSSADFEEEAALPRSDREPYRPWSYDLDAADFYIPRVEPGQKRWFAAVTRSGSKKQYARVLVLAENPKAKHREMVAAVNFDGPEQLPDITSATARGRRTQAAIATYATHLAEQGHQLLHAARRRW